MNNDFHEEFGHFVVTNDTGSFSDRHIVKWIEKEKEDAYYEGMRLGWLLMGIVAIIIEILFFI